LATTTPIPATSPRRLWRAHWAEFTPFPAFPPEVRRVIYTTNLIVISSLN
jgi:transposase-like protein